MPKFRINLVITYITVFWGVTFISNAQKKCNKYYVKACKGTILKPSFEQVRAGEDITVTAGNTKNLFNFEKAEPNSYVKLISPCGTIMIAKKEEESFFTKLIVFIFGAEYEKTQTSTRGEAEYISYLQQILSASNKSNVPNTIGIIGDKFEFKIDTTEIRLSENQYFLIKFDYEDNKIEKKMPINGDKIIFSKKDIFSVANREISIGDAKKMEIFYVNNQKPEGDKERYICHLKLHFEADEELIKDIKDTKFEK